MRSCILCVHIETSSLWAEFVNKNRCINVRLVSEEVKSIKFDHFDNSHNSFLWPEYFIDFLCERWIPCQAVKSVLCLHYRPETVHCSTKDAYTSEITFLALHPWSKLMWLFKILHIEIFGYRSVNKIDSIIVYPNLGWYKRVHWFRTV